MSKRTGTDYGQPILIRIRLDSTYLILEGAVPAALLVIIVQYGFEYLEKVKEVMQSSD